MKVTRDQFRLMLETLIAADFEGAYERAGNDYVSYKRSALEDALDAYLYFTHCPDGCPYTHTDLLNIDDAEYEAVLRAIQSAWIEP